jgi:uncharacterized membrane protein YhhN
MSTLQLSILAFGAALILAVMDWLAVARHWRRVEYVLKPATLIAVVIAAWLLTRGSHDAWMARFFLPGLLLSLVGDVFLLLPGTEHFLLGLVSFLLAHVCYIIGLNHTLPPWPALILLVVVAFIGLMLFRSIASGLRRQSQTTLLVPVAIYSLVLSLMLFSAWATLFRPEWSALRRGMVIVGASLFFSSDAMLAWNRFVMPVPGGRLPEMVTYHLGQMALAAAIALW